MVQENKANLSLLCYGPDMDPKFFSKYALKNYDLVTVQNYRRFFGFLGLVDHDLEDLFDERRNLKFKNVGEASIEISPANSFNAVLYYGVSSDMVRTLDAINSNSHRQRVFISRDKVNLYGASVSRLKTADQITAYQGRSRIFYNGENLSLLSCEFIAHPEYLLRCRTAALVHGEKFLRDFNRTSYTANRKNTFS